MAWLCRPQRPANDGSYLETDLSIVKDLPPLKQVQRQPALSAAGAGAGGARDSDSICSNCPVAAASAGAGATAGRNSVPGRKHPRVDEESDKEIAERLQAEEDAASTRRVMRPRKSAAAAACRAADIGAQSEQGGPSGEVVDSKNHAGDDRGRPPKRRRGAMPQVWSVLEQKRLKIERPELVSEMRSSKFVGVQWNRHARNWRASISSARHGKVHLGTFASEAAAARAYDRAARRIRGTSAHGGGETYSWRLNFPRNWEATSKHLFESQRNKEQQHRISQYIGVTWRKAGSIHAGYWRVTIQHEGKDHQIENSDGSHKFYSEEEAARAWDAAARTLRGDKAHGGRSRGHIWRLNYPTKADEANYKQIEAQHNARRNEKRESKFRGVSWQSGVRRWRVQLVVGRIQWAPKVLGGNLATLFDSDDEDGAARAYDKVARHVRDKVAHGQRSLDHLVRLNFPSGVEQAAYDEATDQRMEASQPRVSQFIGVTYNTEVRKWQAKLKTEHSGSQHLGVYEEEEDAARAWDAAARLARGAGAHGGGNGIRISRLNFPTAAEVARAGDMPQPISYACRRCGRRKKGPGSACPCSKTTTKSEWPTTQTQTQLQAQLAKAQPPQARFLAATRSHP